MTLEEHLAVPYVLCVAAVRGADGRWRRRAAHPELPGCFGEGFSPEEALAELDRNRERMVRELFAAGAEIPVPRPPLARWMRTGRGLEGGPGSGTGETERGDRL